MTFLHNGEKNEQKLFFLSSTWYLLISLLFLAAWEQRFYSSFLIASQRQIRFLRDEGYARWNCTMVTNIRKMMGGWLSGRYLVDIWYLILQFSIFRKQLTRSSSIDSTLAKIESTLKKWCICWLPAPLLSAVIGNMTVVGLPTPRTPPSSLSLSFPGV